jgi:hypothetical protein
MPKIPGLRSGKTWIEEGAAVLSQIFRLMTFWKGVHT